VLTEAGTLFDYGNSVVGDSKSRRAGRTDITVQSAPVKVPFLIESNADKPICRRNKDTQLGRLIKKHVVFSQEPKQGKIIRSFRRCPGQMCGSDFSRHSI